MRTGGEGRRPIINVAGKRKTEAGPGFLAKQGRGDSKTFWGGVGPITGPEIKKKGLNQGDIPEYDGRNWALLSGSDG